MMFSQAIQRLNFSELITVGAGGVGGGGGGGRRPDAGKVLHL